MTVKKFLQIAWLPVFTVMAMVAIAVYLWQTLTWNEDHHLARVISATAENIENQISRDLEARVLGIYRIAETWAMNGTPTKAAWESDAKIHIRHFPGIQAILWIDPSFQVRWVVPYASNQNLLNVNLAGADFSKRSLETSRDHNRPVMTETVALERGGLGFHVYSPIFFRKEFHGFIGGVFRTEKLFQIILSNIAPRYAVRITDEKGKELFFRGLDRKGESGHWTKHDSLQIRGVYWNLSLWPEESLFTEMRSQVPTVVLIGGVVLSFLFGSVIYLIQITHERAIQIEMINRKLQREMSEREHAERSAREMSHAMENAVEGISRIDENGHMVEVNKAFAQMLGYEISELIGKNWRDTIYPDDLKRFEEAYQEMKLVGKGLIEVRALRKDGSFFHQHAVLIRILDENKKFSGHFGFMKDISDRRYKESLEMKSELISVVSHELRTPLHTIKEGISVVLEGLVGETTQEQKQALSIAKRSVERLVRLVNSVLDFQRLEAGAVEFQIIPNAINSVVEEVKSAMDSLVQAKGLTLELQLAENLPKIPFDHDRIVQVLVNILNNAVKFTPKGKISVSTAMDDPEQIRVSIKDSGAGIKEEDIPKLFKKFSQVRSVSKDGERGAGLGLAISKKIIDRHQGRIWAETGVRGGSVFSFILPVHPKLEV